jgi:hypothetical protein
MSTTVKLVTLQVPQQIATQDKTQSVKEEFVNVSTLWRWNTMKIVKDALFMLEDFVSDLIQLQALMLAYPTLIVITVVSVLVDAIRDILQMMWVIVWEVMGICVILLLSVTLRTFWSVALTNVDVLTR